MKEGPTTVLGPFSFHRPKMAVVASNPPLLLSELRPAIGAEFDSGCLRPLDVRVEKES
jgi:hypothetical protein